MSNKSEQQQQRYYADYERTFRQPINKPSSDRSKSSPPTSNSSSRTSSSTSLQPTSPVAEWCHQMHMIQQRKYDWCDGCHPKVQVSTLKVPSQKAMQAQRYNQEPSHAYQ
ncbi:uncharacterized protein A1O9_01182 [Exophiala aquamarina CBS 119918]|uniref:Uncharacterized protein n=1 Tax=Exophiala aquamarina CBS 119918 TaxID=1182545 RepID=A0A072Q5K0_9EURO|nr:uncharacterized protein A1O9_01182 [Exophiala aquamarina CBS 119918]KEF63205.1 hypothetical protein A1O9_01182 [Exophiala aquamarina CBS 119918]